MRRLMKLCVAIMVLLMVASCATKRWADISSSVDVDSLMQQKFPTFYQGYKNGALIVYKIEQRTEDDGKIRYRITYKEVSNDNDDDFLLWQCVFMQNILQ